MAGQQVEQAIPQLGHYLITEELFRSGHGVTYAATMTDTDRPVMLQVIDPAITNSENFIVRFELMKTLLPSIRHANLLSILELSTAEVPDKGTVYTIARERPPLPLTTLSGYDFRDASKASLALEQVFCGIANGLAALEGVNDLFHKYGVTHSTLNPSRIYLAKEKALVGAGKLVPKIDGFCEAFLFYGDGPDALNHYYAEEAASAASSERAGDSERYCPPASRTGSTPAAWWHQYAFGAIAYEAITRQPAKGAVKPIQEYNTQLDPLWHTIITRCLQSGQGRGYESMHQVGEAFETLRSKQAALPATTRRIREREIPEGMALVMLDGKAELGSHAGPANERPAFRAKVKPFYIDATPVTNTQFSRFLRDHHRSSYSRLDGMPATLVSWHMAKAYCQWRSEQEDLPPDTYRLPTEYEWETAARGITGYQHPWGAEMLTGRCHCGQAKEAGAIAVTAYPPARFGIYDMLGNVWEWTESEYAPHPFSKDTDPRYGKGLRVVKGGCWLTPATECRAGLRHAYAPAETRGNVGFRCARTVEEDD